MKRKIMILCVLAVLGMLLLFPDSVSKGATDGLMLWFSIVFPALLPFMILSGVIVRMNITATIGRLIYPLFHRILGVSESGCYPVVVGFLSGYPLGAKTLSDLYQSGKITGKEGQYLLSFCNNASPMFMLEYMGVYCIGLKKPWLVLLVVYGSGILNALFLKWMEGFRDKIRGKSYQGLGNLEEAYCKGLYCERKKQSMISALDDSILDSFVTLAKVGGYIILFSIFAQLVEELLRLPALAKMLGLGIIEITTGGEYIKTMDISLVEKWIAGCLFCGFGGFSSIAQTASVLQGSGLSMKRYIAAKISHALMAAALGILIVRIIGL